MQEQLECSDLVIVNGLGNVQFAEHQTQSLSILLYSGSLNKCSRRDKEKRTAHLVVEKLLDDHRSKIYVDGFINSATRSTLSDRSILS